MRPRGPAFRLLACAALAGVVHAAPCPPELSHLPPGSTAGRLLEWSCQLRFLPPGADFDSPGPFSFAPWFGRIQESYHLHWERNRGFELQVELPEAGADTSLYRERVVELAGFLEGFLDVWNHSTYAAPCSYVPEDADWEWDGSRWSASCELPGVRLFFAWNEAGFPLRMEGWQGSLPLFEARLLPERRQGCELLKSAEIYLESGLVSTHYDLEYALVDRFLLPARLVWKSSAWGDEQELRIEFRQYAWREGP